MLHINKKEINFFYSCCKDISIVQRWIKIKKYQSLTPLNFVRIY